MALQTQNKNYFKVNLDNTKVINNNLIVSLDVYEDMSSRNNEKNNLHLINRFIETAKAGLEVEYNGQINLLKLNNIDLDDKSALTLFFDANQNLKELFIDFNKKQSEFVNFIDYFFKKSSLPITLNYKQLWQNFGFREEWLNAPIIKKGTETLNLGKCDGTSITLESIYSKLKTNFCNCQDC